MTEQEHDFIITLFNNIQTSLTEMRGENAENTRRIHDRIDGIGTRCDSRHGKVDDDIRNIGDRIGRNEKESAVNAAKNSGWGALGGAVTGALFLLGKLITGRM